MAVLVESSTSWGRGIVRSVLNYDRRHGPWHIFIEPRGIEEGLAVPRGWRGDGVIARIGSSQALRQLQNLNCPVVNVSGIHLPNAQFPQVTQDLEASGRMAATYFLERGYRHCGYFSLRGLEYVRAHQTAFATSLEEAGAECSVYTVRPRHGAEPNWNLDQSQLVDWLRDLPKPVAILSWNASGSREVLYAALNAGLLVPEDVAVLSQTDDDLLCAEAPVPLSGIRPPTEQIGFRAAELLDRMMKGTAPPDRPILLPPLGITTRQSTDILAVRDPALLKAVRYVRANASRNLRVSEVVQHSGVSRRVLESKFATHLKRSPAEEIRCAHLELARELLEQTALPIPDVAEASGFGSPERLAVVFRKATGTSPLRYRKAIRA